jgi:AGZA family xanthine/uracil permease-like MFS transporter
MPADAESPAARPRWLVAGDIDGFFGLFVDNLSQLIVVVSLLPKVTGLPDALVVGRIVPGIAVSLVAGNLFYAWLAWRLARRTGKPVTALPFGINTVSLFAFVFLILAPVYRETKDADLAWKVALAAGLLGGVVEIIASFFGAWVRRHTPRPALLSALAGVAVTFISMSFVFQIFASPLIALFPALLVLIGYAGRVRWPLGLPTGFLAVLAGVLAACLLRVTHVAPTPPWPDVHPAFQMPVPIYRELFSLLADPRVWQFAPIFIPMAVLNVIGSMMNLESAEAAGDVFPTRPALLANGISAVVGVFFGNPFAPTIYIGHPGWKAMGARAGYSVLNALAITAICLTGVVPFIQWFMPLEATLGILLWIGLVITAQAFQETRSVHAPAVALGFIPALAAWALLLIQTTLGIAAPGYTLAQAAQAFPQQNLFLTGLLSLGQESFILISVFFAAILTHVIDRKWRTAACWCLGAGGCSALGIIHAFVFKPDGGCAPALFKWGAVAGPIPSGLDFAAVYLLAAALLFALDAFKPREQAAWDESAG